MSHVLFALILGHLIGDFLFQTDSMAKNKATSTFHCIRHAVEYTTCVVITLSFIGGAMLSEEGWIKLIVLIFLTHFPIDRWSIGKLWCTEVKGMKVDNPIAVVVCIVVDNTLHLFLMFCVLRYMGLA